jgi:hypothetical protein
MCPAKSAIFNVVLAKRVFFYQPELLFLCQNWLIMNNEILIIGRKKEIQKLDSITQSKKSEFLTVYGRRRVGKIFLIREYFDYTFAFQISGLANADMAEPRHNR